MTSALYICRVQNNFKDSDKYIKDFKWIYFLDYQFAKLSFNLKVKQIYINEIFKIFFCNYCNVIVTGSTNHE